MTAAALARPRRAPRFSPRMTPQPSDFRILVVDDEIPVLDVMAEILSAAGWTVDATASPTEALERIRRTRYDALVVDLSMPELPGLLLHAKVKVADRELHARTVFVSGHFGSDDLRRELEGSPWFVPKPFRAEALIGMVGMALPEIPRSVSAASASVRPGGTRARS